MRALLENQIKAIQKLNKYKVGALFMNCGTGKTQTAVELINSVNDIDLLVWLCPSSPKVIENLKKELELCDLKYTPLIVGIEGISLSNRIFLDLYEKIEKSRNCFIVCDESLKIKNFNAKRTKRIIELGKLAQYKLILNGTPVTKSLIDIWPQMEFLSPKILNMGLAEFKNTFCEYTVIKVNKGDKHFKKEFINKYHNTDYLLKLIEPFVYTCDLELSLQKQYINIEYEISDEIKETYFELKKKYLDDKDKLITNPNIFLEITQKMQHIYCCSPEKFTAINPLVDEKTIIYCKFINSKKALEERFPNTLILTYGKNSLSLNLQNYNKIIYFDKTFDYAFREQSEKRIWRTGQLEDCIYYDLTGNVGLEKIFDKCIEKKLTLIEYFKASGNKLEELL